LKDQFSPNLQEAALALTVDSDIIYRMIAGTMAGNSGIVDPNFDKKITQFQYSETKNGLGIGLAVDSGDIKREGYYMEVDIIIYSA
jgi:hypothetical protein